MPTLVLETGEGLPNANTYAATADGDTYHEGHLYPEAWTAATADRKAAALIMATRTIQNNWTFAGFRKSQEQALEWPRVLVPRPDLDAITLSGLPLGRASAIGGAFWDEDSIPAPLRDATCELARVLLEGNRAADDPSQGIQRLSLGQGAVDITFNPQDRKDTLPQEVQRMLGLLGGNNDGKSSQVRTTRVQ